MSQKNTVVKLIHPRQYRPNGQSRRCSPPAPQDASKGCNGIRSRRGFPRGVPGSGGRKVVRATGHQTDSGHQTSVFFVSAAKSVSALANLPCPGVDTASCSALQLSVVEQPGNWPMASSVTSCQLSMFASLPEIDWASWWFEKVIVIVVIVES